VCNNYIICKQNCVDGYQVTVKLRPLDIKENIINAAFLVPLKSKKNATSSSKKKKKKKRKRFPSPLSRRWLQQTLRKTPQRSAREKRRIIQ